MRNFIIIFISIFVLVGCNKDPNKMGTPSKTQENVTNNQQEASPDYQHVYIYDIKRNSIFIAPPATDPVASYPVYEIFMKDSTVIEGSVDSFDDLSTGDDVKVWVKREGKDKEVAEKIIVDK